MNKLSYGSFDSSNTDIAFSPSNGYSDPSSEETTRKQLSYPLKEIKTYINRVVPENSDGVVVKLLISSSGTLQYKTDPTGAETELDYPKTYYGTGDPSGSLGKNGDIYIKYETE